MSQGSSQRRVALLVSDGSNPFECNVAVEIFGISRPELDPPWYDLVVCGTDERVRMREGLYAMECPGSLADAEHADTVIAPNRPDVEVPADPRVLEALRRAHARGARLVSFCTGAFTLAEAGLLDGRPATTHWMWTEAFRRRFPKVELRPDVLFVDDGDVLTAAGSAAALDLCLHLVRRDHGAAVAHAVSKRLVFAGHRDGGQQQFIDRTLPAATNGLGATLDWARAHLAEPLTVRDLARQASTSPSALHRRFRESVGTSPLQWLLAERVDHARHLLESTDLSVDQVALRSGLGTSANLRTHFSRRTGLTPSGYRLAHQQTHGDGAPARSRTN